MRQSLIRYGLHHPTGTLLALLLGASLAACGGETEPPPGEALKVQTTSLASGRVGETYQAPLAAAGGSAKGYQWSITTGALPEGLSLAAEGTPATQITGTPQVAGTFPITVTVADDQGGSATASLTVRILERETQPPALELTTHTLPNGVVGQAYSASLASTGGSPGGRTWSVESGSLPPGLSLGSSAGESVTVAGTPTEVGSFTVTIAVRDDDGGRAEREYAIEVTARPVFAITTGILAPIIRGEAVVLPLETENGAGESYTWSLLDGMLPPGITLDAAGAPTGHLRGTATQGGHFNFTVRVEDGDGQRAERFYGLQVQVPPPPVVLETSTLPNGVVGEAYDAQLVTRNGTQPFAWSVSSGALPPGLSLVEEAGTTARVSGTPTADGSYTFDLRVEDDAGTSATGTFTVVIALPPEALVVATSSVPSGVVGEAYSATIVADGGVPPYSWVVAGGALPPGLSLPVSGTPSVTIGGTPSTAGTFTATVAVFDSDNRSTEASFTFVIAPPANALLIQTLGLPRAPLNQPYTQVLRAQGGSGIGYVWSVVQGNLPPGLSLAPNGTPETTLSGVASTLGTYNFTVQVEDSNGESATQSLSLEVNVGLQIATTVLPVANLNEPYSQLIVVLGGTGNLSHAVTAGQLPAGLSLAPTSGGLQVSGTPTDHGGETFELLVTDTLGITASRRFSLNVRRPQRFVATVGRDGINRDEMFVTDLSEQMPGPFTRVSPTTGTGNTVTSATYTVLSPDNARLAFRGTFLSPGADLFVSDLTGVTPQVAVQVSGNLVAGGAVSYFIFSPDGKRIVYKADQDVDNVFEAYAVDLSGPTPGPSVRVNSPFDPAEDVQGESFFWSPDSTKVTYHTTISGSGFHEVHVGDVASGIAGQVLRLHRTVDEQGTESLGDVRHPVLWTPDSRHVIYAALPQGGTTRELYMTEVSGPNRGQPVLLSAPITVGAGFPTSSPMFEISPDGTKVIYAVVADTTNARELFLVDLTPAGPLPARKLHPAFASGTNILAMAFSPDSTRVLYTAGAPRQLYMVDVTDPNAQPVVVNDTLVAGGDVATSNFGFSPDGSLVAYVADGTVDAVNDLYVVDVLQPQPWTVHRVSSNRTFTGNVLGFEFSPDGARIAFRGPLDTASRNELYVSDLTGAVPAAGVRVHPAFTSGGVTEFGWARDGSWLAYRANPNDSNNEGFRAFVSGAMSGSVQNWTGFTPSTNNRLSNFRLQW